MLQLDERLNLHVGSFVIFFGYLRVHMTLELSAHAGLLPRDREEIRAALRLNAVPFEHKLDLAWQRSRCELVIEALIPRPLQLDQAMLTLGCGSSEFELSFETLSQHAAHANGNSLAPRFREIIRERAGLSSAQRPRMLDIGGRARSGIERRSEYPDCEVTVFDLEADPSVDVVGDAHQIDAHFEADTFDFVLCVSVFEHLLMPWKVALAMNRVMKPGGLALIHTHQTIGMHDLPWDFYRYSSDSWHGLFNRATGFEVVETMMADFMHIVPRAWTRFREHAEVSGGFESSSVILRKIGPTRLEWPVRLEDVIQTAYPLHPDGNFR